MNIELEQGKTIQELVPFTHTELATFCKEGMERYNKGLYDDAGNIFLFLTQMNPKAGMFWQYLGMTEYQLNHIQTALQSFILAEELETTTLVSYLYAAKCLISLGKRKRQKISCNGGSLGQMKKI